MSASKISRRRFLELSSGLASALAASPLAGFSVHAKADAGQPVGDPPSAGKLDYAKARAIPTICFGCTTHCGVIGWVQDGRVKLIEGNPLDPNTQGTICSKANGMLSYTYQPERLLYPLKRVGARGEGRWRRISWAEALDEIAAKMRPLREQGRPEEFVFHYGRDKTKGLTKRFTNAFGTPNRLNRRSICSSNRRVPLMSFYGREFEWETQDFANTRYIINFGANPMEAYQGGQFHVQRIISAQKDHGAKLVTFEVRPSATASVSDEYHPIAPGTDGLVALAMANVIIDEGLADTEFWARWVNVPLTEVKEAIARFTPEMAAQWSGVKADDITRIAREFAKAAPHCTTLSNRGSAKHYNGVQSDRAIRMLDPLVGNVGREGGFCLSSLRTWNNRYGQWGLPVIAPPGPTPPDPAAVKPGTPAFAKLAPEVQARVAAFPEAWQNLYMGELATPSEFPLSWVFYAMRVGQLVYPYIREGRGKVSVYMSYTLGAAYGYPEANEARAVLKDESLIPFHVAIDIGYSEQAALADIILPEATSLERWDAHSANSHSLRPYTGIRQPLVEPMGEARPLQIILRDLARRLGEDMAQYFDFEDVEDFYRQWHANVPLDWESFKRRGIWYDPARPLDYALYERPIPAEELIDSTTDPDTGIIRDAAGKMIGIRKAGQALRGFATPSGMLQVKDEVFPLAAKLTGLPESDVNGSLLPTWAPVPDFAHINDDELVLTTFKWNVHTQGRSSHWKYHAEIVHTNQAFIGPETAARFGLVTGDTVELTVKRPTQGYRGGETAPVGVFRNTVRVLAGVSPGVIACAHHAGHWEHGAVARAEPTSVPDGHIGMADPAFDADVRDNLWWAESRGGTGNGVQLNDNLPINPTPLVGGQNWFDNVVRLRKVG